jgi:hypothetical protein
MNSLFVGARGASWAVAKFSAGVISPPGVELHLRMSSTSCSRRRAKCREGLLSKTCHMSVNMKNGTRDGTRNVNNGYAAHTED